MTSLKRSIAAFTFAALAGPALGAPALWEASDTDSKIWLFGSVHGLPEGVDWRTPALQEAMDASEHVYFETDIGPLGIAALTIKIMIATFQNVADPWLDRLSDEDFAKLADAAVRLGLPLEQLAAMPPWLVALQVTQLSMQPENGKPASELTNGVDFVLQWQLAKERKAYFETPGEQFDLLAAGTVDEQIAQLLLFLDEIDDEGPKMDELVAAWQSGDIDFIADTFETESEAEAAAIEKLLYERNRNWMPAIETLLRENREDLIVVGAGHLAGDGSVLDLLAKAGYTVKRIQ